MSSNPDKSAAFTVLAAALAVSLLAAAGILYLNSMSGGGAANGSSAALAAISQSIPRHAVLALNGDEDAFNRLQSDVDRLDQLGTGAAPGGRDSWDGLMQSAASVLGERESVETITGAARLASERIPLLLDAADEVMNQSGSTGEIQEFQRRAVSLEANLGSLARSAASGNPGVAQVVASDMAYLRAMTDALSGESTGLDVAPLDAASRENILVPVISDLADIEPQVAAAVNAAANLATLEAALDGMAAASTSLFDAAQSSSGGSSVGGGLLANPWLPIGLLGAALLMLVGLAVMHSKASIFEQASREQTEQNERNQQAILRLLDELGSLADGDLTVEATVTEDITGAIADSINYAIEKLRELVATINETAIMVDSAAKSTASTATHMARAAETQTREIAAATESIVSMAGSIEEVSGNAERSSDVARHSVEVAHKGGEAVRRTIDGMNTIRETIQETSKRIKRLGESSQEIGNIIELINDIAEQTNILALNASIQASMAGEAGRGFAVVADEVQRLAERSTNATKQIEVLVRTIQSDTNEAVVSMERSTTDVVGGALLAENAGAALDEIEQVSNQIANLVQNISGSARQQAGSAADVTRRTTKLKEISDQTGKATTATAASISNLSDLASQLRQTVAGFTLPSAALQASALS
ncbi:MAG: methyl-accepting chemotaxis protein, partial [Gammaproteobacteria bacterium]|nr:methyl-accepting chemotaxis protein [Gammaproteobacteria bacterium]